MLDIGFSEIALIFTLALIVLGPEKLPRVASQVGRWIGRARGMARQFREQLEEEVNLEETRKEEARKARPSALTPPLPAVTSSPAPDAAAQLAAQPQPLQYPDSYSHAHATDSEGRPLPSSAPEHTAEASAQQDWVGGVTGTDEPAQGTPSAGYAPPHERGT